MKRARRTNAQINALYRIYQAVKGEFNSVASLSHFLDISTSIVIKWNNGAVPLPDANPKPKDFYNERNRNGYNSDATEPVELARALPTDDEVYLMLVQGYTTDVIAMKLDLTVESVVNTKAYYLKENIISPAQLNADLTIHEIATVLGLTYSETTDLYDSGLKKIMDAIGEVNDLVNEPSDDEAFRDYGNDILSKHYSLMMM